MFLARYSIATYSLEGFPRVTGLLPGPHFEDAEAHVPSLHTVADPSVDFRLFRCEIHGALFGSAGDHIPLVSGRAGRTHQHRQEQGHEDLLDAGSPSDLAGGGAGESRMPYETTSAMTSSEISKFA